MVREWDRIISEETRIKMSDSGIIAQNRPDVKRKHSEFMSEYQNRPEQKERQSKHRANLKLPTKDTKPEITLQKICKEEGIEFVTQKTIKLQHYDWHKTRRHQVDLFIEPNICILADGDYWHANPNPHRVSSVRLHKGIKPDKVLVASSKKKKIAKYVRERDDGITLDLEEQGYKVLRLWASDLEFDAETCRQKIVDVVRNVE